MVILSYSEAACHHQCLNGYSANSNPNAKPFSLPYRAPSFHIAYCNYAMKQTIATLIIRGNYHKNESLPVNWPRELSRYSYMWKPPFRQDTACWPRLSFYFALHIHVGVHAGYWIISRAWKWHIVYRHLYPHIIIHLVPLIEKSYCH